MKFKVLIIVIMALLTVNYSCASNNEKEAKGKENSSVANILNAENMNKFNELISGKTPVLVDFYADWCAPCRMMAPILEKVAGNLQGDVKIVKVNVDNNREAAMKYGIRSIPTLMLFQNGEVKWQGVGVIQADQIEQIVKSKTN
jgi:thioredoxin 1